MNICPLECKYSWCIHTVFVLYVRRECCVGVFSVCVEMRAALCYPCVFTMFLMLDSKHDESRRKGGVRVFHASCQCHGSCWRVVDARINVFHASRDVVMLRSTKSFRLLMRQSLIQSKTGWESTYCTLLIRTGDTSLLAPAVSLSSAAGASIVESQQESLEYKMLCVLLKTFPGSSCWAVGINEKIRD